MGLCPEDKDMFEVDVKSGEALYVDVHVTALGGGDPLSVKLTGHRDDGSLLYEHVVLTFDGKNYQTLDVLGPAQTYTGPHDR